MGRQNAPPILQDRPRRSARVIAFQHAHGRASVLAACGTMPRLCRDRSAQIFVGADRKGVMWSTLRSAIDAILAFSGPHATCRTSPYQQGGGTLPKKMTSCADDRPPSSRFCRLVGIPEHSLPPDASARGQGIFLGSGLATVLELSYSRFRCAQLGARDWESAGLDFDFCLGILVFPLPPRGGGGARQYSQQGSLRRPCKGQGGA